jgi:hypothetical protein
LSFKEILMGWYKNLTSAQKTMSVEFHAWYLIYPFQRSTIRFD